MRDRLSAIEHSRQPRLAIVVTHPIQHFCPLYRRLAERGHVGLKVFFASEAGWKPYKDEAFGKTISWGEGILEGVPCEFLPGAEGRNPRDRFIDAPSLNSALKAYRPDCIAIYGLNRPLAWRAMLWAALHRTPTIQVADSEGRTRRRWMVRARKRLVLPLLLRSFSAIFTVGDESEAYYRRYGAAPEKLVRCPFPIDDTLFDDVWQRRGAVRKQFRELHRIPSSATVFLIVGKLIEEKAPMHVLKALERMTTGNKASASAFVVFAGDGPARADLEKCLTAGAREQVRFLGFVSPVDLAGVYASSDVLVHPSERDAHPLAISEALFFGLPVLVSDRVGSIGPTDDVRPGWNGFEYRFGDTEALASRMELFCSNEELRRSQGRFAREVGRVHRLSSVAEAFEEGVWRAIK